MVTVEDICNLALSRIGDAGNVVSIAPADDTEQAEKCARFYPMAREIVLEAHDWNFNTTFVTELTLQTFTDPDATSDRGDWMFGYLLPAGVSNVIAVLPPQGTPNSSAGLLYPTDERLFNLGVQPYEIALDEDGDQVLYTNVEDAALRYSIYVTDPQAWPALVVEAVAWRLAAMLSGSFERGEAGVRMSNYCDQQADKWLERAADKDANQSLQYPTYVPGSVRARD